MELKLKYLSLYVGAFLKFKESVKYTAEGFDDSASLMFQKEKIYQLNFWILEILSDKKNAKALENAYLILKSKEGLASMDLKKFDLKNRHDVARAKLMYSGEYLNVDVLKEGWLIIDDSMYEKPQV